MAENSRSISQDLYGVLGLGAFCKLCKSLVSKRHHEKESKDEPKSKKEENESHKYGNNVHENKNDRHAFGYVGEGSPKGVSKRQNHYFASTPAPSRSTSPLNSRSARPLLSRSISISPLSRERSKRIQNPMQTAGTSLLKTMSRKNGSVNSAATSSLSRNVSRRGSTPIMYSSSNGLRKPPAMEETLECTLEELCFGCTKKIRTTRDAVTNDGQITQEDEVLTIKVKPGWRKGTKITFEGMGNETPGALPADIIFTIEEKRHHLYKREGDDLELAVKIPLLEALIGCTLPIPLLGGEKMTLTVDDIIHPGYRKIIAGQGMPKPQEKEKRGNLIITFVVEFPVKLTEQQRSDVVRILQDSF